MSAKLHDLLSGSGEVMPVLMDLRERLQKVELDLDYMRSHHGTTITNLQEGINANNNRLTSQYQRIASLEDTRHHLKEKIAKIEQKQHGALKVIDRLQQLEVRQALLIEVIKYAVPFIVVLLLIIEKAAPGTFVNLIL